MTILLKKKNLINVFFVIIIILPMLNYFQLLYDYFFVNLNYFTLHDLWSFMVIFNYFWLFLAISP